MIENHPRTVLPDLSLIANGVTELQHITPFWIYITNFKDMPVGISKHTTVGLVLPFRRQILHLSEHSQSTSDKDIPRGGEPTEALWEGKIQVGNNLPSARAN